MVIYDFDVHQGETFKEEIKLVDIDGNNIDLTGKTAKGQIRKKPKDPTLIANFATSLSVPKALITFELTATQTAAIPVGQYFYDICAYETISGVRRIKYYIGGKFVVLPSVTEAL